MILADPTKQNLTPNMIFADHTNQNLTPNIKFVDHTNWNYKQHKSSLFNLFCKHQHRIWNTTSWNIWKHAPYNAYHRCYAAVWPWHRDAEPRRSINDTGMPGQAAQSGRELSIMLLINHLAPPDYLWCTNAHYGVFKILSKRRLYICHRRQMACSQMPMA